MAYYMYGRYSEARYTVLLPRKTGGTSPGSAQDVEPIPLWEAAENLILCVEDQGQPQVPDTYENLRNAIVDAVQMSTLAKTADLKQHCQWLCVVSTGLSLPVVRGLAHDPVCLGQYV